MIEDILVKERRFIRKGEWCAVSLKSIYPVSFSIFDEKLSEEYVECEKLKQYVYDKKQNVKNSHVEFYLCNAADYFDDDTTIVEYEGGGIFKDLVSGQQFLSSINDELDFGSEVFNSFDDESKKEVRKIVSIWNASCRPSTWLKYEDSAHFFIGHPLAIDMSRASFMPVPAVRGKVLSEQIKSKLDEGRENALVENMKRYEALQLTVYDYYDKVENSSSPMSY